MTGEPIDSVTVLLAALDRGDASAAERLFPIVYGELRTLAARQLRQERSGHTLVATALVHEAYLKLVGQRDASWQDRAHFLAVAAMAMRRILVSHAKSRRRLKRGGDHHRIELDELAVSFEDRGVDVVALDDALERLRARSVEQAKIVDLRFFGGLTVEQVAVALGMSERSVHRDWALAKAWLRGEIEDTKREVSDDI